MAPLLCGHCLQVHIDLKRTVIFVDEITAFAKIIVGIDDLVSGHRVRDTLYIDVALLLTTDLVLDVGISFVPGGAICSSLHARFTPPPMMV